MRMTAGRYAVTTSFAAAIAIVLLIAGVGAGYFAGQGAASPTTVTQTRTVTQAGAPVTVTSTVTTTATVTAVPKPSRVIKVGGSLSLGGIFVPLTGKIPDLTKAWADIINERGGIYVAELKERLPIQFIIRDDQSNPQTTTQIYESLIKDEKVDILISAYSADLALTVAPIAERNQVPFVLVEASTPELFQFKWVASPLTPIPTWSTNYFDMIAKEGKAKTVAFVGLDITWARDIVDVKSGAPVIARRNGLQVVQLDGRDVTLLPVGPEAFQQFPAVVQKLKAANPDIVYFSGFAPFARGFLAAAKEGGLNPKEFHVTEYGAGFVKDLGPLAQHVTTDIYWLPTLKFEGSDVLREALRRAGIDHVEWQWASLRMIAFQMIQKAIEKAGSLDKTKLRDALRSLSIMTVAGPLTAQPDGQGTINVFTAQWQTDKLLGIWTLDVATGRHVYPRQVTG